MGPPASHSQPEEAPPVITLADARRIIAAAEKKDKKIGQPMNIAFADDGGNPCGVPVEKILDGSQIVVRQR